MPLDASEFKKTVNSIPDSKAKLDSVAPKRNYADIPAVPAPLVKPQFIETQQIPIKEIILNDSHGRVRSITNFDTLTEMHFNKDGILTESIKYNPDLKPFKLSYFNTADIFKTMVDYTSVAEPKFKKKPDKKPETKRVIIKYAQCSVASCTLFQPDNSGTHTFFDPEKKVYHTVNFPGLSKKSP